MYSPSYRSRASSQFDTHGDAAEFDELKLTLKYENESSKNLPTKVELEICDAKSGRVVFRKRQNIYYVKLQENLSSLNSAEDYVLTVTSISGSEKAEEKVTIHNKYYKPEEDVHPDECMKLFLVLNIKSIIIKSICELRPYRPIVHFYLLLTFRYN